MASPNCLAGCIGDFLTARLDLPGPAGDQAESFAPWCWIKLGDSPNQVTVGNESFEGDPNTACIKSFEVGWVGTTSMKVEIVDEAGGTLGMVADTIRKCGSQFGATSEVRFQWGWVVTECKSSKPRIIPSDVFKSYIQKFDVSYSEGKIKYTIECSSNDKSFDIERIDGTTGDDQYPVDIEQAIAQLCARAPPCTVRYVERQPDGKLKDVKFIWARVGDPPKAVWQTDNLSRLSIIMKWLGPFRVKDGKCDKGIIPYFSPDKPDEICLLKDPTPGEGEVFDSDKGSIGTYIVNGGKCSSVIEFTPSAHIVSVQNLRPVGGGTSGPNKSSNQFAEDAKCESDKKRQKTDEGTQMQATITQQAFDSYGVRAANEENLKSEIAHNKASFMTAIIGGQIEADMRILGDPRAFFCQFAASRKVSVVVINPFHLRGSGCGDWLARPGCNEIFSNKLWMVQGINHTISPGTYTTTLKLILTGPQKGEPPGGNGSGGVYWKNTCEA